MRIARSIVKKGLPIVGVPKTIDNDLSGTVVTFGFDTAVTVATEAIDRLHSTAEAHERVFVVEVMGRYAGWIALHSGVSATADVVLIPEIPFDIALGVQQDHGPRGAWPEILDRRGRRGGATDRGRDGDQGPGSGPRASARRDRAQVAAEIEADGQGDPHGGARTPPAWRRSRRPLTACCRCVSAPRRCGWLRIDTFGVMVALDPPTVLAVPIEVATERMKCVPLDCDTMLTARDLGISFGDEVEEG